MAVLIPIPLIPRGSAHTLYFKVLFYLLFPEASPLCLHNLALYKSANENLLSRVARPLVCCGTPLCPLWIVLLCK